MEAQILIVSRLTDPIGASGINKDGLGFGLRQGGVAEKMLGEKHGPGRGRETGMQKDWRKASSEGS